METRDWIILAVIAIAAFFWWLKNRTVKISGKKVAASRSKTVRFLEEAGYEVLKAGPAVVVRMTVDGRPYSFEVKSDYLARKSGRLFLVKVKRDKRQVRLQSKQWRASLLQDVLAFRADGVIMVYPEKEKLQEIIFRI